MTPVATAGLIILCLLVVLNSRYDLGLFSAVPMIASPTEAAARHAAAEPVVREGLYIRSATYGGNCGASSGNATGDLTKSCNGNPDCNYVVDVERLRDPAPRCGKDFVVEYSCAPDTALLRKELPAEAGLRSQLRLSCARVRAGCFRRATIRSATYGGNCGAALGNATEDLAGSNCNGSVDCNYVVDVERLRDPAPRCGKDFVVEYSCTPDTALLRKELPAEAGLKSQLELSSHLWATRAGPDRDN